MPYVTLSRSEMDPIAATLLLGLGIVGLVAVLISKAKSRAERLAQQCYDPLVAASGPKSPNDYDVIIVGASIAGCAAAKRFSDQGRKVLLIERELSKPDRIVGELMQPGGIDALKLMGMEKCAIDVGQLCTGYVAFSEGQKITLPYKDGFTGCSFHFGDFVMNLRKFVRENCSHNVTIQSGVALEVVRDGNRATGLRYKPLPDPTLGGTATGTSKKATEEPAPSPVRKSARRSTSKARNTATNRSASASRTSPAPVRNSTVKTSADEQFDREGTNLDLAADAVANAPLVVLCDGSGSNFRLKVNSNTAQDFKPHSHFIGIILKKITLPHETKGHVFLGKAGPFLAYRLDSGEVRMLIDYKGPTEPGNKLPKKSVVRDWLVSFVRPDLPPDVIRAFDEAISDADAIRSMPTPFFQQLFPKYHGCVGIGDHANQRHPLTGGGMTCALRDAVELTQQLSKVKNFHTQLEEVQDAIRRYTTFRRHNVACVNILSWALYAVFEGPMAMRRACFHYFFLGGDAVFGPMSMLSGLCSSVVFLLYHYYRVMFYGTWLVMTHDTNKVLRQDTPASERVMNFLTFWISPWRIFTTIHLLSYSTKVFIPLLFHEFAWRRYLDKSKY